MSQESESKDVVLKYVNAFNDGDLKLLESLLSVDAEVQGVFGKGLFEKIPPIWQQLIEGFGMQLEIQSMIAEGNIVAVRYIERGLFKAQHLATNQPENHMS